MTTDHQNEDVHYLTVSATTNRVSGNHLGRSPPSEWLKGNVQWPVYSKPFGTVCSERKLYQFGGKNYC